MVFPVSLSFSINFIGQHFKDKRSASISPNRHHHHALHKITLSLYSLLNGWSCGSISPGLSLFLWEENVMSHYKLTSDHHQIIIPGQIRLKPLNRWGTFRIHHIQRGGLISIIYSFWMWPPVPAATHQHSLFTQKHISSHKWCTQPRGRS